MTIIGDAGVGKTALVDQLTTQKFTDRGSSTVGVDFAYADVAGVRLQLWDTAGQERFRTITRAYYRGSDAVLFVYDVTNPESFRHIRAWVTEAATAVAFGATQDRKMLQVLIGNKADVTPSAPRVSYEEGAAMGAELGMPFFETSATSYDSVVQVFTHVARCMVGGRAASASRGSVDLTLAPLSGQGASGGGLLGRWRTCGRS
jgi:small GTP-binding protein